jgi:AcrR family transcriptional regulator
MGDLSKAVGVAPSSLYNTFGSKAGLYEACLMAYVEGNGTTMRDALALPDLQDALQALLHGLADLYTQSDVPKGCAVLNANAGADDEVSELLHRMRAQTLQALIDRFEQGIKDGHMSPDASAEGTARFVFSVLQGMSLQAQDGATAEQANALADAAIQGLVFQRYSGAAPG